MRGLAGAAGQQEYEEDARAEQGERVRRVEARRAGGGLEPARPIGRLSPCAAAAVSRAPVMMSQIADAGPHVSTTQPPPMLAAMKPSEPHRRMRP